MKSREFKFPIDISFEVTPTFSQREHMTNLELAKKIVDEAFKGKVDKAGAPYVNHLYRVSNNCSINESVKVIALLHDLLEDCPEWNETSLRHLFPDSIVNCVVNLTRKSDQTYETYINEIRDYSSWTVEVKIADLKDNMDITRLKGPLTQSDLLRLNKYLKAYIRLTE